MAFGKPTFTLKTYGAQLYKWSPETSTTKKTVRAEKPFYCNATAGSQGQDWVTSYSYNIAVSPVGQQERLAYVACDYVE